MTETQTEMSDLDAEIIPQDVEEARKIATIRGIACLDTVEACCLLAFYGQMYFYGQFFWPYRCTDELDCGSVSFWDFELIEGSTWFGIFVVHSFQLLSAIYLCPATPQPSLENMQDRCRSWLYSSKILIKILVFECFILFIPHRKPLIFKWWLFLVKAVFRGVATTIIAHFMMGWMEQERSTVRANTHSTTIIPILSHHSSSGRSAGSHRGRNMHPGSTSIYVGAGLDYADETGDGAGSSRILEEEPPPPYSEAIKYCKEKPPLYLHV